MACSALTESGRWTREAVELQMSHRERGSVRAAYVHRAEHMQERRRMLQWWADYLDTCKTAYIAPMILNGLTKQTESTQQTKLPKQLN